MIISLEYNKYRDGFAQGITSHTNLSRGQLFLVAS